MQMLLRTSLAGLHWKMLFIFLIAVAASFIGVTYAAQPGVATDKRAMPQPALTRGGISPLVDKVRTATARYLDINVALNDGWMRGTPCVSGPNSGAMGVHFILPSRVPDGVLSPNEPEALIYEPLPNGAMRLVGVEFIVLANDWATLHPDGSVPSLDGHLTNYVSEPNRYGLPAFYELHVWAWENNPNGNFADWNSQVTCDMQSAD